ncbi:DUF5118 domain-containing protein [Dyadobacter sp. 676]|uniref:DUF5118 domain-containing protein n=1 Tax=Dyadobacter sp. 676 TaxID=3088362 RepID=A0AAU8FRT6_9BACT
MRYLLLAVLACVYMNDAHAQRKKKKEKQEDVKIDKAVDAVASAVKDKLKDEKKKGPKAFKDLIDSTNAVSQKGMISVHKVDDKWYFEIPDSLLNRDIMTVTRYSKTAAGGGIFGGEEVNRQMIRWEKGMDNNLLLRSVTIVVTSPDSTKPIFQAVKNSNSDPIIGVFDIKAIKKRTRECFGDRRHRFLQLGQPGVFAELGKQAVAETRRIQERGLVYFQNQHVPDQYRNSHDQNL